MSIDAFALAVEDAERGFVVYGQAQVTADLVVLEKGKQKRTWIEGQDDRKDLSVEITIVVNPIAESNSTRLVTRSMIAGNTGEFAKIVWPSLRDACGIGEIRQLEGKFIKAEMVKNGRKWTNKKTGEEQEGTTFKFHAVYTDEAACVAGYNEDGNAPRTSTPAPAADSLADIDMSPAGSADNERAAAWSFLETLAKQAGGNKAALQTMLAGMPFVTKHFTVDSPEVQPLLKAA